VKNAKPEATVDHDLFPAVELWPEPVDGGELILELCQAIHCYVVADKPTIIAAALWAMHSWCMDAFTVSPLAHITAPEKRCGKTVLLTVLSRLVRRPLATSNITPAALFRSVERWQPTLLIDEAETFLRDNEEVRGLINSGLYRETAYVIRTVGDVYMPTRFRTWGAKVVCGIGRLADTIEDRAIPLRLRRKMAGDVTVNIRHSDPLLWERFCRRLARWSLDNMDAIRAARPTPALGLNDRAQDCWEPLLAIADLAGGDWSRDARAAAQTLQGIEEETPGLRMELLRDIKDVFECRAVSKLASTELIKQLTADGEGPWATYNRGHPMTPRQLSGLLGEFSIKSRNIRFVGPTQLKGYDLADFRDAFDRYLSPALSALAVPPSEQQIDEGSKGYSSVPHDVAGTDGNASQTAPLSQSDAGTGKMPLGEAKNEN
jgi:hypothetical protein